MFVCGKDKKRNVTKMRTDADVSNVTKRFTLEQAMKAQRGSRSIGLLFP
jgi:hypothetical protein